jgi:orotidine-5'-phosphate decarboxylase
MKYNDLLEKRIQDCGNPICMGMDPVLKRIPLEGKPEEIIKTFYMSLLEGFDKKGIYPAAVKPNSAYYENISVEAMGVLKELIAACTDRGIHVVLDAKRGDIGKSSSAYADAAIDVYKASSITVSPYMGSDSVLPFINKDLNRGVYALLRTSNPGAKDIQDLDCGGIPLFLKVAEKLIEWNPGNLGAVVGATNLAEMERITEFFVEKNAELPFLIPGVSVKGVAGQQGGLASEVIQALKNGGAKRGFHLLNSSSGLNYAYEAMPDLSYADAAAVALENLIEDCQ